MKDKITQSLGRLDLLMKENFELRRELIFERKKYVDLQHSYQDLRNNIQEGDYSVSGMAEQPRDSAQQSVGN